MSDDGVALPPLAVRRVERTRLLRVRNDCTLSQERIGGRLILECNHCFEDRAVEWDGEFGKGTLASDCRQLERQWVKHCDEHHNV